MGSPRGLNNPNDALTLMNLLIPHLLGTPTRNTTLAINSEDGTGLSRCYVRDLWALSQGEFPAINLSAVAQKFNRNSLSSYEGTITVKIRYYMRWDQSQQTLTADRALISADLERMAANIQNDDKGAALASHVSSVGEYTFGSDELIVDDKSIPGMTLVYMDLYIPFNVLPFDAP